MKTITFAVALSIAAAFVAVPHAFAQECKAVGSDGKPLAGAAKTSFLKKCCEASAKSKDGKTLTGAAKNSYVDKCMKG